MKTIIFCLLIFPAFVFGQTTKEVVIHSKELRADRKLWINTPKNYELKKDALHLVILLDGNNASLFDLTTASKRFLEDNSADLSDYKAPPSIVVGIEPARDRWDDFGDAAGSAKFLSFIEKEVLPYLRENYRTADYKILIGHSLGGRFAVDVLLGRPDLFNAVIAASPAIPKEDIAETLSRFDALFKTPFAYDRAFYFSTTYLDGDTTEAGFRDFAETLNKYLTNKKAPNFRFRFGSATTLGHAKSPFFAVPEGLHFIYSPALWQLEPAALFAKGAVPSAAVRRYEQRIRQRFGIPISTQPYASILVDELVGAGKFGEAIERLKKEIDTDPTDLDLFARLLALLKKTNDSGFAAYRAAFVEMLGKLGATPAERDEWFDWIEKNGR